MKSSVDWEATHDIKSRQLQVLDFCLEVFLAYFIFNSQLDRCSILFYYWLDRAQGVFLKSVQKMQKEWPNGFYIWSYPMKISTKKVQCRGLRIPSTAIVYSTDRKQCLQIPRKCINILCVKASTVPTYGPYINLRNVRVFSQVLTLVFPTQSYPKTSYL